MTDQEVSHALSGASHLMAAASHLVLIGRDDEAAELQQQANRLSTFAVEMQDQAAPGS